MATELLLAAGSSTWSLVSESIEVALRDLAAGRVCRVEISVPRNGQVVVCVLDPDGGIVLRAAGNETLPPAHRLSIDQERTMLAIGFDASTGSWGAFVWPIGNSADPESVGASVLRTMRDVYRVEPSELEVIVTL